MYIDVTIGAHCTQDEHCATRRIIFTYPMVAYTDMEEAVKAEVLELATNACEKFLTDNQSVSQIFLKGSV